MNVGNGPGGTLHEGSNTFYMNLRTFPSIFELRGCLRLPTVACWLPYAAEAHPFDIWWRRSIYRSRMPNTLDWPTFRSNIQVMYQIRGTLHEGSNTFYLNPRTFPSIFEQLPPYTGGTVVYHYKEEVWAPHLCLLVVWVPQVSTSSKLPANQSPVFCQVSRRATREPFASHSLRSSKNGWPSTSNTIPTFAPTSAGMRALLLPQPIG